MCARVDLSVDQLMRSIIFHSNDIKPTLCVIGGVMLCVDGFVSNNRVIS